MRVRLGSIAVAAASCCCCRNGFAAATRPSAAATAAPVMQHPSSEESNYSSFRGKIVRWWRGGAEDKQSWLSGVALSIKRHTSTAVGSSGSARVMWRAYETRRSELTRNPDDPRLQLETAQALLKWIRHTTNGNFPRVSADGRVCDGDSPASRAIWRKHAPEALRLLRDGAAYALCGSSNTRRNHGAFDLAKYRFLQAEASTYLSSAKGVLRAALQADAIAFKRNVKPLINDHPAYQGGVGHTFMGSFYLVAPWPVHNLSRAKAHFEAALKIDARCPRNHYCRGLVALELGDTRQAKASFQRALKCKPTSPEEADVGDFFHAESRGALSALEKKERGEGEGRGGAP